MKRPLRGLEANMRWLKSTTQKSWVLGAAGKQFIVPQCDTRDNKWLVIEEEDFAQ